MKSIKIIQLLLFSLIIKTGYSQVIITNITDTTIYIGDTIFVDVDNSGNNDFMFSCDSSGGNTYANIYSLDSNKITTSEPFKTSNSFDKYVTQFDSNNSINSSLYWEELIIGHFLYMKGYAYEFNGYFGGAIDKYIGISLVIGNDEFYGWILVDVSSNADWITLKSFAFNSSSFQSIMTPTITHNKILNIINLEIFPNPTNGFVNVELNNKYLSKAIIYDLTGKELITNDFIERIQINTKDLNKGVYILKVETNNKVITRKIIIE
jgi:hypothetical protein